MKTIQVLLAACLGIFSLNAAEFSISSGKIQAFFDTKGGGLKRLSFNGKELTRHEKEGLSFTEKLLRSEGKNQIIEDFSALEFTPVDVKKDAVTFSVLGVKNFDFLRLTKSFSINSKENALVVTFKLENISGKAADAGVWTRTMLRRNNAMGMRNTFFYPLKGGMISRNHPGDAKGEEWYTDITGAAAGFMGIDDKTGGVLLLPQDLLCALYSWCSVGKDISTLEFFLKEKTLPPKGSLSWQVKVLLSENVPQLVKKHMHRPLVEKGGRKPLIVDFYAKNDTSVKVVGAGHNVFPRSVRTLDIRGRRQYNDSVRGIRIPGTIDPKLISVYNLANNAPEYDRPVPFTIEKLPSGEQRILVLVPGVNKEGYYFTRFKDGFAYNSLRKPYVFCGPEDFTYRVCFDRKSEKTYPAELFKEGANLVYNGTFEKQMPNAPWAEGYYWSWYVRGRKLYQWVNEGPDNSKCIKVIRHKDSTQYSVFPVFFRPESGVKYHFSADMRGENPERTWLTCMAEFCDAQNKNIRKARINIFNSKSAYAWKKVKYTFYNPRGAEYGALRFGISTFIQTLWVDNVKLVPEDFSYTARSPQELLREECKNTSYRALDFLEKISHEYVTPHTKWLSDPVVEMPEILYLPLATTRSIQHTGKRQIVEFSQRMKLRYHFIPLLHKVDSGGTNWDVTFGKNFEPYTIVQIKGIVKAPKVIIVQDINFKKIPDKDFIALLKKFQKQGSGIMFYNCVAVPQELLGKKIKRPSEIFTTPVFRKVSGSALDRACTVYQNGKSRVVCFLRNRSEWYIEPVNFPCVPPEFAREMCPAYNSRDFRYWEYIYVSALKALRYAAGVESAVKVVENKGRSVILKAAEAETVLLKVSVEDMHRRAVCTFEQKAVLKPGLNKVTLALPAFPGGTFVADYRVTDQKGREYDFGALNFTNAEPNKLTVSFADKERIFDRNGDVRLQVAVSGVIPAGVSVICEIEDTRSRIVAKNSSAAKAVNNVSFRIAPPYTTLYRVHLKLVNGKKELSRGYGEFSMPSPGKDLTQLDALLWLGRTPMIQLASDMGFTYWIANFMQNGISMGRFKALANANLSMVMYGAGYANYSTSLKYRHDIPSDPVRTPCYSDPAHWKKVDEIIGKTMVGQRYRYYGAQLHEIADEAYLGSMVCYSPHCLKDFRAELKKQYGSLEALNKGWGRQFKKWDEVIPVQLKEVNGKENLAPWLDHKMFMAKVFAKNWVGGTRNLLRKYVPNSKAGLSGTQIPGYSYDWVQLMKHIDCLSYYSGIQRKAVHDFAGPGFVAGKWSGGYARAEVVNEFYQKSNIWADIFLGANMVSNFAGHAFDGDITPVRNTTFYTELVNELRTGIDRVILNGKEIGRDIAVLYSQSSLFSAMASIGSGIWHNSMTGWAALLEDLKFNYFYLPYDQLEKSVPKAKVVVLPCAVSLSPAAVKNLQKFVAAGGVVIADFAPGWFNEHGTKIRNAELEKLFGISRRNSTLSTAAAAVSSRAGYGIPVVKGEFRIGEKGLQCAGAEKLGDDLVFINRYGKGNAVLLNILVSGYQDVSLGGVGGEESSVKSGAALFCDNLRNLMQGVFNFARVSMNCSVTDVKSGKLYPCTTMLRQDGANYIFGVLKAQITAPDGKIPMLFHKKFLRKVHIKLPVKGHVYDIRKGKYMGEVDNFVIDLMPGDGQVFSIQKERTTGVEVNAPAVAERGRALDVRFKAAGAVGKQVFRMELSGPDGKIVRHYTVTGRFDAAGGKFTFQFAHNDKAGSWKCRIIHVNSGISAEKIIKLN